MNSVGEGSPLRKGLVGIASVLGLGILGSALWDLLFKPGMSVIGRFFLNVTTLGSTTAKDYAYSQAALDPTPISSLMILLALVVTAFLLPVFPIIRRAASRSRERLARDVEPVVYRRRHRVVAMSLLVFLLSVNAMLFVRVLIHNQSVLIWRVFHNHVERLAPHISPNELNALNGRFASVASRQDYVDLDSQIHELARSNNITLIDVRM